MSLQAFDGVASTYQRHRPTYPRPLFERLRDFVRAVPGGGEETLVDVGAGTGISTRLLREAFGPEPRVVGVEPGSDMRRQALEETPPELRIEYLEGAAEELPFGDGEVTLVLAAQALQWFDRPRFLAEAARVLRPGGTLGVAQNNRCWQESPLLGAYEEFLEAHSPGYSRFYRAFDVEAEIAATGAFAPGPTARKRWTRRLGLEEFVGLARSSTKMQAAMRALGGERAVESLVEALRPHLEDGAEIAVPYVAELYLARRG